MPTDTDAGSPSREPSDWRVTLSPWGGAWHPDDPFAGIKAEVAAYSPLDPLVTLRSLSDASGIPVGSLARYVLARWATGGSEALLELGTSGVDHLVRAVEAAEEAGTDAARLDAYATVRELLGWLRADGT